MASPRLMGLIVASCLLVTTACTAAGDSSPTVDEASASSTSPSTTARPPTTTTTLPPVPAIPPEPLPDPPAPPAGHPPPAGQTGVAVIAAGGAELWDDRSGEPFVRAHEGLVFAVEDRQGDWFRLRTMCDTQAWADTSSLEFIPQAEPTTVGRGTSFGDIVVVLDPGHGGANHGAQGPSGL